VLLIDYDETVRKSLRGPLSGVLVSAAAEEVQNGGDPVQFLLDHLTGQQSLLDRGNANTHAVYRDVAVGALARWLVSDKQNEQRLRGELEQLRKRGGLHLRIAVWNVLVEAAQLREQQERERD
jgi:hypothetical protein